MSLIVTGGESLPELVDTLLLPAAGFVAGSTFSVVLGVAERRRRFDEMSLPRFAAENRELLDTSADVATVGLAPDEAKELLEGGPIGRGWIHDY